VGAGLCVLISLPAFALGHRLKDADSSAPMLAGLLLLVLVLASAIMKQVELGAGRSDSQRAGDSE
jgi:hypothetical protein